MLFNSFNYLLFLPTIFFIYWSLDRKNIKWKNLLLLSSSYFFYGLWDWRFLFLIIASTITDYYIGKRIHETVNNSKRKQLLFFSIIFNVGILLFFKYYNFFIDSWIHLFNMFGYSIKSSWTLNIILPVGISFYTFQTMSYSLDVFNKKIKPTNDFIAFSTFVAFFPQLVAGPIEKASSLLPQIIQKKKFNYIQCTEGLKLIFWGLFKKIVIADALGPIVDDIFTNYSAHSASTLFLGAVLFSFQIYSDFSGYSDIAIGTAKLFGIELISNFKFPYFSKNISEFWQRWHISLSNWFREYVYIPLGGSKQGRLKALRNISIVFVISGFWHGANWTFIAWGAIHTILYIPIFLNKKNRPINNTIITENNLFDYIKKLGGVISTFFIITLSWIFFRAQSISEAVHYFKRIFTNFNYETYNHPSGYRMIDYYIIIILFVGYEFIIRKDERAPFKFKSKVIRFIAYLFMFFCLLLFFDDQTDRSFIYFQF